MPTRETSFERRQRRIRFNLRKNASDKTRLCVTRSNTQIYAQLIDDNKGVTIASASTLDKEVKSKVKSGSNIEAAKVVGKMIAERAKKANIKEVVFDRGGYLYHGRVKALADAAREAGLTF